MDHDGESGGPGKERGRRGVPSWNLSRWGEKRALSIKLELYFGPPHAAEGVGIPLCRFESGGGGGGAEYTAARYIGHLVSRLVYIKTRRRRLM